MGILDKRELEINNALEMRSQMLKSAYAQAPEFTMDWNRSYAASFDFMVPHRDNYGFTVYQDRNVLILLEEASAISCLDANKKQFIERFDPNIWQKVTLEVNPQGGTYDVLLNGELKRTCGLHKTNTPTLLLGDTDPTDAAHGDAIWDNIKITDRT